MRKIGDCFDRWLEKLVKKLGADRNDGKNRLLNQQIQILANGNRDAVCSYHIRKWKTILLVSLFLLVFCLVITLSAGGNKPVENGQILRPPYLAAAREEELVADVEGEKEKQTIAVSISQQLYTPTQEKELLEQAQKELEEGFLGDNPSADMVRSDLWIPQTLQNGAVQVSCLTMPYGILSEDGKIVGEPSPDGTLVELQIILSVQDQERILERTAAVYPPILDDAAQLQEKLKRDVQKAQEEDPYSTYVQLPTQEDGRQITWQYPAAGKMGIWLIAFIVPIFLWFHTDQKIRDQAKMREQELALDYPELVWKMTMLLGAGMTIRSAFSRIAMQYRSQLEESGKSGKKRYAYEEMLWTCYEMNSGIPEAKAYENFGKRCGLPGYVKLGSILAQNLRKGSRGLGAYLEKEAAAAMEERKNAAKKLGEQAGTKILFPMILMLGVVLVILIVPAFLSM
ncbi:MAG: type II secretion system F family protein [Lachnospiraceae bacterium]|nr:type II secretion system F family protein [Lachnospiraceae bacterium]